VSLVSPVRALRAAFVFLTRIPVGGFPYTDDEWRWAPAFFPVVGLVVGAGLGGIDRALGPLGFLVAALGALAASLLATGAFHEDGLADTSDALGGGFDRDKILLILKDSRVGAFGASALVISIVGRAALLARLGPDAALALPLVGMAARAAPVWQIAALPYVSSAASRSPGVTRAGALQACIATVWTLAGAGAMIATGHASATRMGSMLAAMAAVTLVSGWRYTRRLGGITGDFLGATEQLCELAGYGALAWGLPS
jgi:adenosylcobinamide-GDP ribazoletransferase